jgi:hypothetical protein
MKPSIKILYIQCFYMNDKQQRIFSLLCINFQILHCKNMLKLDLSKCKYLLKLIVHIVSSMFLHGENIILLNSLVEYTMIFIF